MLPTGMQNPWGNAASAGAGLTFSPPGRSMIADLALAALKEKKEKKKRRICPQFHTDRSLCFLTRKNPIRRFCIYIVDARAFEYAIIGTILLNCMALMSYHPYPNADSNNGNAILDTLESVFLAIFATESVLKIIAYGLFLHKGAYLRSWWNGIDAFIVGMGLLSVALKTMVDVKPLRAFRVFRPLRLLTGLPSLQVVLNSIIMAMIPLFHIALLVFFVIILFAIVGLELFQGVLHKTCYTKLMDGTYEMMEDPKPCSNSSDSLFSCASNYVCLDYPQNRFVGPSHGLVGFDNIFKSMLTVFVCMTLEGWTTTAKNVSNGMGTPLVWTYFIVLVLVGAFFVMNLVLGVLSGEFSKEKEKIDRTLLFRKERQLKREHQDYLGYKEWIELAEELSDSDADDKGSEDMESGAVEAVEAEPEMHVEEVTKMHLCSTVSFRRLRKFRKRTRRAVTAFINSRYCFALIIILVFLNTVVLTTEHANQPKWLDTFQDNANIVFVALFTIEMLVKMAAAGFAEYFSKLFNRFDCLIVIFSIAEMIVVQFKVSDPVGVSVLRCARLLRIFKLTRFWDDLRKLVTKLLKSIKSVLSLLVLLVIFIVIFALLGMQFLGGKFNFENESRPSANFDGMIQAMLTVFQVLTGEDWNEVLYNGMRALPEYMFFIVIYFLIMFICGNYILLNVFLAIAVDNLSDDEEDYEEAAADKTVENGVVEEEVKEVEEQLQANGDAPAKTTDAVYDVEQTYEEMFPETDIYGDDGADDGGKKDLSAQADVLPQDSHTIPPYSSFFIFSDTNKFRIFCHNVVSLPYFGNTVLALILVSSGFLAAEDPVYTDSPRNKILNSFDFFFTGIFTIEITLKVIAYGFVLHEGAFCRNWFNLLDLGIVCMALISFILPTQTISAVKIIRVLRVLRPLRAINRAKGLKHVVQCMIIAVKSIYKIVLVTFLIMFMFAVIGVQLLKGKLSSCNDVMRQSMADCNGYFIEYNNMDLNQPSYTEREWKNSNFHFDNVANALLTLFTVSTFEGWPNLLYAAIDSTDEGKGPIKNYRRFMAFYFITFIVLIPFFMINIFVGFVIVTFQREGESEYQNCELDKNQRKCIEYALVARPRRRYIPKGHLQYKLWSIVVSKKFELFIMACIMINTIALMVKHDGEPAELADILASLNYFFVVVFTIEFCLRVSALTCRHYFGDPWNVLDFILVIGGYIDIVMSLKAIHKFRFQIIRLVRVLRVIKLLNKQESIRQLLWTFVKSLQALPYVTILIAMIFFIYGVFGMQLFGRIDVTDGNLTSLHTTNNFKNFVYSIIVLFRCATGEAWQEVMLDCAGERRCLQVDGIPDPGNCGSTLAYLYFMSFYFVSAFLVINLFIAVIMDNFDYLTRDWSILGPHHLEEFVTKWAEYDHEAKGRVRHLDVVTMLGKISPPLGFGSMCPHTRACHKLVRMNMPLNSDGTVFFNATLFALVRRNLKIKIPGDDRDKEKSLDQLNEELRVVIKRVWRRTNPKLLDQIIPPKGSDVVTVGKFYATFLIQNWFREWQKRKMIEKDTRYIPQIMAGDRAMPHQPTIGGFPRRCSSDITGDEIQRRRGADKRDTSGGVFGRTLAEWTRRQSNKWSTPRAPKGFIGGAIQVPVTDEHGVSLNHTNGSAGLTDNVGKSIHPAVAALLAKEKEADAEAAAARLSKAAQQPVKRDPSPPETNGTILGTASSVLGFFRTGSFRFSNAQSEAARREGEDINMARHMLNAALKESYKKG